MKTLLLLLLFLPSVCMAQFKTNTLYGTLQPIDMGLGLRYDKQLSDKYGAYTSLAHGNYRFGRGYEIPHHVRAVVGALRYEKQYKVDYFIWGVGACFSRTGEGNVIIMDMPARTMFPVSFELVVGALAGRWAIGFRYDPLKNESAMDLGIRF